MHRSHLIRSAAIQASPAAPARELDLFRVFAVSFGQPSRESFAWLSGEEARFLWRQLGRHLHVGVRFNRAHNFADYSAYEAAYIALFDVGIPEPPVPLLESAHLKRAVPQEVVLDCVNFYDVLGLQPSGSAFPPDHLVTQLEFLAAVRYLCDRQTDLEKRDPLLRLERDFIKRHPLSWLSLAQQKLDRANPPVFPMLLRLLIAYLQEQVRLLTSQERR